MNKRHTEKMMQQLESATNFDQFYQNHADDFLSTSLAEHVQALIRERSLSRADVIKAANLDRVYGYQMINGTRMPTRDKLIQLAFGLQLDMEETQTLLKRSGQAPLYARVKRDAAIIFCINNEYDIIETQSFLDQAGIRIIGE